MAGTLDGVKVVELAGIGPAPFAGMMLADMGADVVRVDRIGGASPDPGRDLLNRGRRSIAVDLKHPGGRDVVLDLVAQADVFIEGFRPGVCERLGLGPDACLERNPRLVYGRMTGWGQDGPYAASAGHDINYIALAGVLHAFARHGERPVPPLNLVGDFGGGGMFLAFGIVCALLETGRSGRGQVIDASMVDGSAVLSTMAWAMKAMGVYNGVPGTNLLDTGAHFYDVYRCADGECVSIGPIEPQFYAELVRLTGFEGEVTVPAGQFDQATWPARKDAMAALFATRTRAEWCELLEGTDACFAPVLSFDEAAAHPHNRARGTFVERDGVVQPAPAPRFDRTPGEIRRSPPRPGEHTDDVLGDWLGPSGADVAHLRETGAVG